MKLEDYIKLLPNLFKRVKRLEKDGRDQEGVTWDSITGKPAVIASGTTQATARQSIGAGTGNSNLAIGTTATTAKAGNYQPTWEQVTGKPTTFDPVIGTTATTAKAGNYVPAWSEVTGKPATFTPTIGTTAATAKAGNYTPSATEIVTAIEAMTPEQVTAVQTKLGIVIEP